MALAPTATWVSSVSHTSGQCGCSGRGDQASPLCISVGRSRGSVMRVVDSVRPASGRLGALPAEWSARHAATSTFSTVMAKVGQASTQAGARPSSSRGRHMSHLVTMRRSGWKVGTEYGQFQVQYWQPMQSSALCWTIPLSSLVYASVGQPWRQAGSRQWLQAIDRWKRFVSGNEPPSISPTRRQAVPSGSPFCSAQAASQEWQPTHASMENPKRYCSPASRGSSSGRATTGVDGVRSSGARAAHRERQLRDGHGAARDGSLRLTSTRPSETATWWACTGSQGSSRQRPVASSKPCL